MMCAECVGGSIGCEIFTPALGQQTSPVQLTCTGVQGNLPGAHWIYCQSLEEHNHVLVWYLLCTHCSASQSPLCGAVGHQKLYWI